MEIIDNAVPKRLFEELQLHTMNVELPWYFTGTAYNSSDNVFDYSWSHLVFSDGEVKSKLFDALYTIILATLSMHGKELKQIHRIRLGLMTPQSEVKVNEPHIDASYSHTTGLIYMNTSDAPTILYKQKYDSDSIFKSGEEYYKSVLNKNVDVDAIIECKENRLVLFDGFTYHSSCVPTDVHRRVTINFNYS